MTGYLVEKTTGEIKRKFDNAVEIYAHKIVVDSGGGNLGTFWAIEDEEYIEGSPDTCVVDGFLYDGSDPLVEDVFREDEYTDNDDNSEDNNEDEYDDGESDYEVNDAE